MPVNQKVQKCCLVALISFIATVSFSQNKEQLLKRLKNTLQDSIRVNILNALSKEELNNRSTEARPYAEEAKLKAQQIHYVYGIAQAYSNLGYCLLNSSQFDSALLYFNKGIFITVNTKYKTVYSELLNRKGAAYYYKGLTDSALWYFKKALREYEGIKDSSAILNALNNIGAISIRTGDMDGALNCFFKCLSYDEKQNSKRHIAMDCDNIAVILTNKKDFNSAQTYSQRALKLKTELKDTLGMLKTYLNIGAIYEGKKEFKEAIRSLSPALRIVDTAQHINEYARIINNLGSCYSSLHDYANALYYLVWSLNIKKRLGDNSGIASTLGNIGGVYYNQKNYLKAVDYYIESDRIAIKTGDLEFRKNAQKALTEAYLHIGQSKKAAKSFSTLMVIQDSLYNEISNKQATDIQIKYETDKKEKENKLLQQQNAIKTLENENNTQKLKVRNQTIFILIAAFIIAVMIVFWQISLARIKKQKRQLETEKKLQADRERISRDLHDNVGGQLSYVLFSLEGEEEKSIERRKEKAHRLAAAIRGVTGNLRETIWALNSENLNVEKLSDKLKTYARNIFLYSSTKLKFEEYIEQDEELNAVDALNLFRISQEIIHNAFKHANASEVRIVIRKDKKLSISISDNGTGFSEQNENKEHYGLVNLKKRAAEINALIKIESSPGKGTIISVIV
jgi:signal transduction histidine kinase/Tfp pilus assembly protein PilF